MVGQMICEADRSQVEEDEPISSRRLQYAGKDQLAFVVRLEGNSSKTISVMMEKKNPRMSQPMA